MYYKKKDPDLILWERIKNGELPYVSVVPNGSLEGRFTTHDLKTGMRTYDRAFRVIDTKKYQTLQELIDCPMNAFKMIFIAPPTEDSPYWLDHITVFDPHTFETKAMVKRYFRVAILNLDRSQEDYILYEHKKLMEKRGIKHEEDSIYEESLIDNTNYRRRLLLTKKR